MFEKVFSREEAISNEGEHATHFDSSKFAPNTKIAYKPTLIPTLQKENQELLSLYGQASKAAHARNTKLTKKLLAEFKYIFVHHVLHENTSLYIYLQHSAKDLTSKESIRYMKSEMDKIARKVIRFVDYGVKESTSIDYVFLQKMDEILKILRRRIKEEENFVYPNYLTKGQDLYSDH